MPQNPPQSLADFAWRVLLHEAGVNGASDLPDAFRRVCRSLHGRLAPLISSAGFYTLMARAVSLAARDFPLLAGVRVGPEGDCALSAIPGAEKGAGSEGLADALSAVLAQFIWLLVIFIGEDLALRKVRAGWPEVPFDSEGSSAEAEV